MGEDNRYGDSCRDSDRRHDRDKRWDDCCRDDKCDPCDPCDHHDNDSDFTSWLPIIIIIVLLLGGLDWLDGGDRDCCEKDGSGSWLLILLIIFFVWQGNQCDDKKGFFGLF